MTADGRIGISPVRQAGGLRVPGPGNHMEAARKILDDRCGLTEAQAASRLRRLARRSRWGLADVAQAIIALEDA